MVYMFNGDPVSIRNNAVKNEGSKHLWALQVQFLPFCLPRVLKYPSWQRSSTRLQNQSLQPFFDKLPTSASFRQTAIE